MKTITIVTGVLLMLTGVWCLANPGATFLSLAFIIGIVMLVAGFNGFFLYGELQKQGEPSNMILPEAILTVLLGIVVLSNQLISDAMIPAFFGMWIMFNGIMRVMQALAKRKMEDDKGWGWTFAFGLVSVLAGFYSFYNPVAAGVAIVILVGVFFMLQGANLLVTGLQIKGKKK